MFADQDASSARIVRDPTGKAKGFGYVEFPSVDKLKEGLAKNMTSIMGRTIRVSVAEPRELSACWVSVQTNCSLSASQPRRDGSASAADSASEWRRSGPLPAREAPALTRRQPSFADRPVEADRDWSGVRGAKFVASPNLPSFARDGDQGFSRSSSGYGRDRLSAEPGLADDADQWRSSRPLVEGTPASRGPSGSGFGRESSGEPSAAETEATVSPRD